MNPFQTMTLICLGAICMWAIILMFPNGTVWIHAYGGVWYSDWYYWHFWLPGEINRVKSGQSDVFDLEDLPMLEKRIEDHLTGKDL